MAEKVDVVVVGAGVIGAATTFELARQGRAVTVVDAGPAVGAGSTSASSAIIRFHFSTWEGVLTAWESAAMWRDVPRHLGLEPAGLARFVETGCLVFDPPGGNRESVLPLLDRAGIDYELLAPSDLRLRFPALDIGDFWPPKRVDDPDFAAEATAELGAYFTPQAGFIDDPMLAAANFMAAASSHGARLLLRQRVVEVRRDSGRVAGVTLASGEEIDAPVVVNAGGPESGVLNRLAGVAGEMRIRHRPLRQEVIVAAAPDGFTVGGGGTVVSDTNFGTYFRPHPGGTLLMGGTEPACDELEWVEDPAVFNEHPSMEGFERISLRVARRLPTLGLPHRPVGLAALYDASDDWLPIYDRSSLEGFFMACGTSGNQFKNAPMAGRFMAALVEASERGIDHDTTPIQVVGPHTGQPIDLGAFSRLRDRAVTSGSVMG
jgi:sarcosine oxidase subunit beta